eukprot:g3733.t1
MYLGVVGGGLFTIGLYKYFLQTSRTRDAVEGCVFLLNNDDRVTSQFDGPLARSGKVHKVGESKIVNGEHSCTALQFWVEATKLSSTRGLATVVSCTNVNARKPQLIALDVDGSREIFSKDLNGESTSEFSQIVPGIYPIGQEEESIRLLEEKTRQAAKEGGLKSIPIPYVIAAGVFTSLLLCRGYMKFSPATSAAATTTTTSTPTATSVTNLQKLALKHISDNHACGSMLGLPIEFRQSSFQRGLNSMNAKHRGSRGELENDYLTESHCRLSFPVKGTKAEATINLQAVKDRSGDHWRYTHLVVQGDLGQRLNVLKTVKEEKLFI